MITMCPAATDKRAGSIDGIEDDSGWNWRAAVRQVPVLYLATTPITHSMEAFPCAPAYGTLGQSAGKLDFAPNRS